MKILLAGRGRLTRAIEERLISSGVIVAKAAPTSGEASRVLDPQDADRLLLAADDDSGNLDLVLTTRRTHPSLPIVVRIFEPSIAEYVGRTLRDVGVMSMSASSAPAFIEAVTRVARPPAASGLAHAAARPARRWWQIDRVLAGALLTLLVLVAASALFFSAALELHLIDALYFVLTTVTTVGYGDIALRDASTAAKIGGMFLMLVGAAFLAVVYALLTDWVLARRLDVLSGRVRVRGSGHVVLVGAGNIGYRVAEGLGALGHRIVVIERAGDNRHVGALRSDGHQVIIGDGASDDLFSLARVHRASCVLAVTESDATNLQVALAVTARAPRVPVVMRAESPVLSAHVSELGQAVAISPVDVAAAAFVAAALAPPARSV